MKTKFNGFLTLLLALVVQVAFAQKKTITGTVSDSSGSLPGVSVILKGSTSGTETDFDGKYSISAKKGDVLVFRYLGYKTIEKTVANAVVINLTLQEDASVLDEIVVVGYGTNKKETVSSAVNFLKAEDIENRPTGSLVQAMQAQTPGLNISTANGQPGANSTILLRGVNSLSGNNEPLFIIDGIPVDEDNFRSINQNDIASISILKDASATAIYGNRATGGVIIVTTKRGKAGQKTSVQVTSQSGVNFIPEANFSLTNSKELLRIERDRGVAIGGGRASAWAAEQLGLPFVAGQVTPLTDAQIDRIGARNTDWKDHLLRIGSFNNHNISVTGGSEDLTIFTSLGYFEQEGITLRSGLQRMTLRNNTTLKKDRFKLSTNLSVGFSRSDFPGGIGGAGTASGSLSNPFIVPFVGKPYLNPFNADGSLNLFGDPDFANSSGFLNTPYVSLNVAEFDQNRDTEIRLTGGIGMEYDFLDNLKGSVNYGIDHINETNFQLQPTNSIRGNTIFGNEDPAFRGSQNESLDKDTRMNVDVRLAYNDTYNDKHNVSLLALSEFLYSENSGFGFGQTGLIPGLEGTSAGFVSGQTTEDPDGDGADNYFYIPGLFSFKNNVSQFSIVFRGTYDYDGIVGGDFTVRRDGSSRFSEQNRWGTFGAVGAFVNLTKFLIEPSDIINDIKLRGSYGTTGNDRLVNAYYGGLVNPFDLFNTGVGYNGSVGLFPSQIGNRDLKWETAFKANIGLDFRLLDNRLSGAFEVYRNITKDLFLAGRNTLISGFGTISGNLGEMENKGIEANLNYDIFSGQDFKWSIGGNIAYNKNTILELKDVDPDDNGEIILNPGQRSPESVGRSFNSFYVVKWAGVNPANGAPLYLDRDGNITEVYDEANRVFDDRNSLPGIQGGFNTSISYKGFFLDALFSYATDVYRNNGTLGVAEDPTLIGISNVNRTLLDAWKNPGDLTSIPALNTGSTRLLLTDRYIEDASYIRLKNVSFGYQLTKKSLQNTPFDSVRIFAQGENLLTWTKWRGFDPEFDPFANSDFFSFPNGRSVTIGIDLKF
ncbi:TonB-dependent receptor [uncultured Polaribacter sp.]|uniref:SusC/RagA family TonB-linked outer membrane protein n=1 Tax=uncultured Polaribacter sp. TaxID=174711 RepID=UPI0026356FF3|nr:TonB-dependent receptor [uncultured Polaribacter sp.]